MNDQIYQMVLLIWSNLLLNIYMKNDLMKLCLIFLPHIDMKYLLQANTILT